MAAETDEEAVRRSANGPGFFAYSLGYYYNPVTGGAHRPGRANIYDRFSALPAEQRDGRGTLVSARLMSRDEIAAEEPTDEVQRALFRAARSGQAIGTTDTIRRNIKAYEDNHLDVLVLVAQCGDRRHEHIMESIERFGTEVLPEFKERHEAEHRPWREKRLGGLDLPVNSSI